MICKDFRYMRQLFIFYNVFFLSPGLVCNRLFDNYACWPDGLPNATVSVTCPWYLPWHNKGKTHVVKRYTLYVEELVKRLCRVTYKDCVCLCVFLVHHGMVYQECDASGQWATMKNTSECDSIDQSLVRNVSRCSY